MAMTNGTDGTKRGLRSLSELPRDVAPPRDLWPSIAAQLGPQGEKGGSSAAREGGARFRYLPTGTQWAALAAVVTALAVGMWLGRSVLPGNSSVRVPINLAANPSASGAQPGGVANGTTNAAQPILASSFVTDPRYTKERATMIAALEAQLNTLPPETQAKVAGSLKTIRASMKDIQAALGRDPANALLQELLVNTYQDEMRLLSAVHEASGAGQGT